jgi:hypothetical protein
MTNFATCEKYRIAGTASTGAPAKGIVPVCLIRAFGRSRLLEKSGGQPSQVLYLDLRALDEIFGPVLYNDDPAKRSDREKTKPEQQTEITHAAKIVLGFAFWVLRLNVRGRALMQNSKPKTQNF